MGHGPPFLFFFSCGRSVKSSGSEELTIGSLIKRRFFSNGRGADKNFRLLDKCKLSFSEGGRVLLLTAALIN
jgi:hypothetical protein